MSAPTWKPTTSPWSLMPSNCVTVLPGTAKVVNDTPERGLRSLGSGRRHWCGIGKEAEDHADVADSRSGIRKRTGHVRRDELVRLHPIGVAARRIANVVVEADGDLRSVGTEQLVNRGGALNRSEEHT